MEILRQQHGYNSSSTHCCAVVLIVFLVLTMSNRLINSSLFISYSSKSKFEFSASTTTLASIVQLQAAKITDQIHSLHDNFDDDDPSSPLITATATTRNLSETENKKFSNVKREEEMIERGLARARASIRKAATVKSDVVNDLIYRNRAAFYQSYTEMEKRFKVYVYSEGDPPIVHDGPCKNIYTIEGRFIHEIEQGAKRYKARDPKRAHVFFMPFSVTWMVKYLYKPLTYDITPLRQFVGDYIRVVSIKYPFWNRTRGGDHFMLACHDWGPHASQGHNFLYNTSIRVLCNANTSEGFNPRKDVSLPEIHLYDGNLPPQLQSPPPSSPTTTSRPYLAFFAGGLHGPIRPLLLNQWKHRDSDIRVYAYLPKHLDYYSFMLQSKFCLCPSGHEVASPRIVEAIYSECVPVILSDHYVLPFSDVLRWEAFSIQLNISEIPRLKEILRSVSKEKYEKLKEGLRSVRRHFMLNQPARRFDVFHMILHSIWLRRLNLRL